MVIFHRYGKLPEGNRSVFFLPQNPRIIIPAQVAPDIRCVSTTRQRRVLGKWRSQSTVSHATIVEIGYEGLYIILAGFS